MIRYKDRTEHEWKKHRLLGNKEKEKERKAGGLKTFAQCCISGGQPRLTFLGDNVECLQSNWIREKYAVFADVSNVVFNVWRLAENRPVIKVSSCAYQHLNLKFKGKLSKALQKYLKYKTAYPFQYVHLYTVLLQWHPEAKGASKLRLPCSLQRQGPSHYIRGFMTL